MIFNISIQGVAPWVYRRANSKDRPITIGPIGLDFDFADG